MDYVPWPDNGCSLAEARERTAERTLWARRSQLASELERADQSVKPAPIQDEILKIEEEIAASFRDLLTNERLIAYGSLWPSSLPPQRITTAQCVALTIFNWEDSSASNKRPSGFSVSDIRVYPTLLAPCRDELMSGLPLLEAFRRLVLSDPEVASLGREAVRMSPIFEKVFGGGRCLVRGVEEWPLAFERWTTKTTVHPDPAKRSRFDVPRQADPIEVVIAADARVQRYRTLISLMRAGELEAHGIPGTAGPSEAILRPIWSHEDFHFDPATGDILQSNPKSDGRHDRYIKRWIGVVLQRPASTQTASLSPPGRRTMVHEIDALTSAPADRSAGERPFTVDDVLALGSLSEALTRLVFQHPIIQALRATAAKVARENRIAFDEHAHLISREYGRGVPLMPLVFFSQSVHSYDAARRRDLTPEERAILLDPKSRTDVDVYYDTLYFHAHTLIAVLQNLEVIGRGYTSDGHLVPIARSIWNHKECYVHPSTGDIYETGAEGIKKKWTGVVLEAPVVGALNRVFHGKATERDGVRPNTISGDAHGSRKSRLRFSIKQAVADLWPNGVPPSLPLKDRDYRIAEWQKSKSLPVASSKTIRRHLTEDGRCRS